MNESSPTGYSKKSETVSCMHARKSLHESIIMYMKATSTTGLKDPHSTQTSPALREKTIGRGSHMRTIYGAQPSYPHLLPDTTTNNSHHTP